MGTDRLFDPVTKRFKPLGERKRLTVLDQYMLENAIRRLDADLIRQLWAKHGLIPVGDMSADIFWATVHRIRLQLVAATDKEKSDSEEWLRAHGFEVTPV